MDDSTSNPSRLVFPVRMTVTAGGGASAFPRHTFSVHEGYARHRAIHHLAADVDREWVG